MHIQITILEDDPDIREICTYILIEEGYSVQGFADIASFYGALATPNLFLLDIKLPDGDGLKVCEQLKKDPQYAKIPVIMMSAHLPRDKAMQSCPADDFLEKPFDIEQLLARVSVLVK